MSSENVIVVPLGPLTNLIVFDARVLDLTALSCEGNDEIRTQGERERESI